MNQQSLIKEVYQSIPYGRIAPIISENHPNTKVTDTLISEYITMAESRQFKFDVVITEIRKMNKFSLPEYGHIDFILSDGSNIVISEGCYNDILKFSERIDGLEDYLSESKDNFMKVLRLINNTTNRDIHE